MGKPGHPLSSVTQPLFTECVDLGKVGRVLLDDAKIILPFLLVSEPAASDRKDGSAAAAEAAAR